ncbi:TIGR03032 family protein [soil metagenome]
MTADEIDKKTDKPEDPPLLSVHTSSLPPLLDQLGVSVLISTYQAGKLIVVRSEGSSVNTHFRNFNVPMGLALNGAHLAIGTKYRVEKYQNQPDVAAKLEKAARPHDACYMPRSSHLTGYIQVHEMAFGGEELWVVNTRFSCLCTLQYDCSFVPRWRPPFVSKLAMEDRCHLNGLGMRDNQPRYVTALGTTDTAVGWRPDKATGGILMDVLSNEFICRGLSMPHSPRWYADALWVCESGAGSLSVVDQATGKLQHVCLLPGFTRGVDFYGPFAFIGLSQVRESAVFSGIPITDRLKEEERMCGLWVVDVRTGETVAFLRFDSGVQEIFAVQVLPNQLFPEILTEDMNEELLENSFILPDVALKDVEINVPKEEDEAK